LVRLRLALYLLEVEELGNVWMGEDMMTSARAPQLETERLDEASKI